MGMTSGRLCDSIGFRIAPLNTLDAFVYQENKRLSEDWINVT